MTSLKDIVADLADAAKRGALTDEELERFLRYLIDPSQGNGATTPVSPDVEMTQHIRAISRTGSRVRQPKRKYSGRGQYGWVNLSKARELNLVALLELNSLTDRRTRHDHISTRWGHHFQPNDLEILPEARQPRWQKACDWDLHSMGKEGLVQSPRRGVWELTVTGKQQAQSMEKNLT